MINRSRHRGLESLTAASLLLLTAACGAPPAADARTAHSEAPVLATVGDISISKSEVELAAGAQLKQLDQKRHELLEQALAQVIDSKLIQLEAKKRGVTEEALMAQEVKSKVTPVSDAEVDAFYEERKAQIRQPKEELVGRIREFLGQGREREAYETFVGSLRSAYPVKNMLDPIRAEVAATGPASGPATAAVTIVEFSDFQCPYCSKVVPVINQAKARYGDTLRVVFRQFPLNSIHPQAQKAAEASLCAADQGKFWEFHDAMFADQGQLGIDQLKAKAKTLGIDEAAFATCLDGGSKAGQVQTDLDEGMKAGVTGTPAMFVNGRFLNGAVPFEDLSRVIDDELARKGVAKPAAPAAASK